MGNSPEEILQKAVETELSEKEREEMLSLFHKAELEYRLKGKLMEILEMTDDTATEDFDLNHFSERIMARIQEPVKTRPVRTIRIKPWLKVAAALVLGLVAGKLWFVQKEEPETIQFTSVSPKGSVSQSILPDSTFLYLNSGSTLRYHFNKKEKKREIFLEGEAWFQVHKSAGQQFVVHTNSYDVTVTGTEFNVKAYNEDREAAITLEKGSVTVSSGKIRLQEPVMLHPGEQLSFNRESREIVVKKVITQWYTSWKDNKLIFVNMNLSELMVLLERKYGVDIRIDDQRILNYHYDGTLKNETILEVLNLLRETLPIQYVIKNQTIEIRKREADKTIRR
jgi:ferric-dicitrate binding protein FerR (iron transport regulator)